MEKVKNSMNKLVCRIDRAQKIVEIVHASYVTTIRFLSDGQVEVVNTKTAK